MYIMILNSLLDRNYLDQKIKELYIFYHCLFAKTRITPAKCANYGADHLANYTNCSQYTLLFKINSTLNVP